ncbi:MAG TPA: hypothetical protein VFX28_18385, partial [Methylomirabilota bacterium]|nr:hypothetical protein [Methylomirabilota bacterium]
MGRERAVLALGLALAGCAPAARGAPDDVIPRILPSTVQLRAERADGGRRAASGVVLASDAARGRS